MHDIDYDENAKSESFGSVEVKSENGSLFAYPILIVTSTARGDSTIENAQDILPRLLDLDPHGQIVQDGLVYTFDHQNSILSVLIEGEEKNSDAVEIDSQLEIDDSNINVTDNSDNGEENNELYDEILSGYQELRENLKDPDSIKIQGVQLTSDKDIVFKYTATNGFGGRVTEYSIYKGRGHLVSNDVASLYWRNYNESVNWNDVVQYSKSSAYTGGVVVIENN